MASEKNFVTKNFLSGAFYAPIALGVHQVTFGNVKPVIEDNDNGEDASYISAPIIFDNGREVAVRFYSVGAQIFCNQVRQQLEDQKDYDNIVKFLKTLKDKQVKVWISKRTYTAKDGSIKSTLQYDFVEPVENNENNNDDEEEII